MKSHYIFLLVFGLLLPLHYASGHAPLNSDSEKIGNYEVWIATDPEIPAADQKFQLHFRVSDLNENLVDHFTMGVRIYYNDHLIDTIPPQSHDGGQWDTTYLFHESGNHVFMVDLYNAGDNGETLTYTFNVSAVNIFGPLFIYIISAGGLGCFAIVIWIWITKKKMKPKP